ncbi:MAG TPA: S8 family serine peptidase [Hyphomicrobiaceae bacterium]|nr:S8 family serine peptidase [Hyphomicrobiaceae bacterium]
MGVDAPQRTGLDGSGVLIGFVDYGFDILHPTLLDATGSRSRFAFLWDQNAACEPEPALSSAPARVGDFERERLDVLVDRTRRAASRAAADATYDPHANYFTRRGVGEGAHGTMMASIAAGTPFAGFRGAAPGADLIGVQLALPEQGWKEVDECGVPTWTDWDPVAKPVWNGWRSYDESQNIVSALDYIYTKTVAFRVPALVINLSIGAWAGAHDGCSAVERKIAELAARSESGEGPACAVVVLAGNAGADDGHFAACVSRAAAAEFQWRMGANDPTQNKLEIWYGSESPLRVTLAAGEGDLGPTFSLAPGPTHPIRLGGRLVGVAEHATPARGGLSRVRILLHPPYFPRWLAAAAAAEIAWRVRVEAGDSEAVVPLHAWIERDDGIVERSILLPSHPTSTLAPFACAEGVIAVAAYDHHAGGSGLFAASALGPRPWGRTSTEAPLIAAPGHRIWGAKSKSQGFALTSGTSPACALVSGTIALLMQKALREGKRPSREALSASLFGNARFKARRWTPRLGYGPADIGPAMREATG